MAALPEIVPQRTRSDCAVAALATVLGWTYERAHEVLGAHATTSGTHLISLAFPLLNEGVAATHIISSTHPEITADLASRQHIGLLASPDEIRRQLQGRRAILTACCRKLDTGERAAGFAHAIAWDGARAIECGSTAEGAIRTGSEIDIADLPLWEVLILTDAPVARPKTTAAAPRIATSLDDLAGILDRHERAFLAFSGGKESVALAHMLAPWRDRVALLWANTNAMAPHMVDFVRRYREQGWTLHELASPNIVEHWQAFGIPAEVFPQANVHGSASPRLQPWAHCCNTLRQEPINVFLRAQPGPCAFINGQRRQDEGGATVAGLSSRLPPTVEIVMPLASWSEADVFAYIEHHGLVLPPQYAEGYADSIECIVCPVQLTPERLGFLRRHHPEIAAGAALTAQQALQPTINAAARIMQATTGEHHP